MSALLFNCKSHVFDFEFGVIWPSLSNADLFSGTTEKSTNSHGFMLSAATSSGSRISQNGESANLLFDKCSRKLHENKGILARRTNLVFGRTLSQNRHVLHLRCLMYLKIHISITSGSGGGGPLTPRFGGPSYTIWRPSVHRVATAQGKQGIWFLLFPDRENTGNFVITQGKFLQHRENIFIYIYCPTFFLYHIYYRYQPNLFRQFYKQIEIM